MGVLLNISRKAKLYGRKKKVYPFQFQQSGLVNGKHRTYFKARKPWLRTLRKQKRYPTTTALPPVGFVAYKKPPRAKIKRANTTRLNLRRARIRYVIPLQPVSFIPFKKPPRAKIKRGNATRLTMRRIKLRYVVPLPPVTVIAYRKPPRAKIKRGRSNIRTRAKLRYVIPAVIVQNTATRSTIMVAVRSGVG